ncbi:Ig-like domain-containing protein [Neobacillus sp. YX16]|uniref:Ig-like domain-containing protein n=1 Tax=Neobacillus sp. YX16 TaxID=3047874 RepID=UPI0024C420B7|nr:Ig-like domain-containing protein [Neobacillus sp. YX16]WHZ02785.1 Ig-like domain-containing protein [Neobacillus sp. YX16]
MRKLFTSYLVLLLVLNLLPMNHSLAAETDYYHPYLRDIYFGNNQDVKYGDTLSMYAMIDNNGFEVNKISVQMKSTSSMATFVIDLSYDSSINRWTGQRKIDEPSWLGSSWIADRIILKDNAGHTRIYSEHDRYYVDEYFNWNDLLLNIASPADPAQVQEKTYQGTVWKDRTVDLTSDYTNNGTLIIENSTIKSNGFKFINNGTIILKGKNTFYVKDGWDGYRGYGELILKGPWLHEIGIDAAAMPKLNRVTNTSDAITGYGEIGAHITVYGTNKEVVIGSATVGEDMRFSIPLAKRLEGGSFSSGLYVEMKGQAPEVGSTYGDVWDVIAPSKPNLYKVNELTTKVKGSTDQSSTIFIKRNYNSAPIAEGYTDDNLQFSIEIPKQEVGDEFVVYAVDFDGNVSEINKVNVAAKGTPTTLSGSVSDEILYAENGPYLVSGEVILTNNITIEPGIEFIAAESPYPRIKISGTVYGYGREDAPIIFNKVPVMGNEAYFSYAKFLNLDENKNMLYMQIDKVRFYHSKIINTSFQVASGDVQNSLFLNSPLYFGQGNFWGAVSIRNNTFVMDSQSFERAGLYYEPLLTIAGYDEGSIASYAIKNNSFITSEGVEQIISFSSRDVYNLDLTNNYWGTTDVNTIKDVKLGGVNNILFEPYLTKKPEGTISYAFPAKPIVDPINKDERIVKGTGTPGYTVKVSMDNFYSFAAVVKEDGKFSIQIPNAMTKDTKIRVFQLDENGISSSFVTVPVKDLNPPSKPKVDEVTELSEAVVGGAEEYSTIKVSVNGSVIGTGKATNTGYFSVSIPKQNAGTLLDITATDDSGNVSEKITIVVKDLTAPAKPAVNQVTDKDTTVTGTAEDGATINVLANENKVGNGTAGSDGKFSVGIPIQKAGLELAIIATDKDGNTSQPATIVVKDVTAPAKPVVYEISDMDNSVWGQAEAGSTVLVSLIGSIIGSGNANENGDFVVDIPVQKAGTQLVVTVKDKAGNISETVKVTVQDLTPPDMPVVNEVSDKDTKVTGQAEAGSTIEVKEYFGTLIGSTVAGADGKFSVTIPLQTAGTKIEVTAEDKAGNVSEEKTIIVLDKTAPTKPVVYEVTDISTTVTGEAEPGSKVEVKVNDSIIGTGTASSTGRFNVNIPIQKAGTTLSITASDKAGNVSIIITVSVIDTSAPSAPIVDELTDKETVVKGSAEPGSTVKVKVTSQEIAHGTTDGNGNFSITIPAQASGKIVEVYVVDENGKISPVTKVTVQMKLVTLIGDTRYATAVKVSQTGWKTADTVLLVNGFAIVDGLTATPLASAKDAPILLTAGDSIPKPTMDEITRLKAKEIVLIGGDGVITSKVASELDAKGFNVTRIGGLNRKDTSLLIAKELDKLIDVSTIHVTYGWGEPDALSIAAQAGLKKQPIILADKTSVPAETLGWLKTEALSNAYFIGGEGVVAPAIVNVIDKITSGNVLANRLSGLNRHETNAKVMSKFYPEAELSSILVAKSESANLVDALAAGPLAAKLGSPVLLISSYVGLLPEQKQVLAGKHSKYVHQIGGGVNPAAVSEVVQ